MLSQLRSAQALPVVGLLAGEIMPVRFEEGFARQRAMLSGFVFSLSHK